MTGFEVEEPVWSAVLPARYDYSAVDLPVRPALFADRAVVTSMRSGTVAIDLGTGKTAWTKPASVWIAPVDPFTAELALRCRTVGECTGHRAVRVQVESGREFGVATWAGAIARRGLRLLVDHGSREPTLLAEQVLSQPRRASSCSPLLPFMGPSVHVVPLRDDIVVRTPVELSRIRVGSCPETSPPVWRNRLADSFLPAVAVAALSTEGRPLVALVHGQDLSLIDASDGSAKEISGHYAGCSTCLVERGNEVWAFRYGERGIQLLAVAASSAERMARATEGIESPSTYLPGASVMSAAPLADGIVAAVHLDTSMQNDALVYASRGKVRWVWRLPPPPSPRGRPVQLAASAAGLVAFFDGRSVAFWKSPVDAGAVEKRDGSNP